MKRQHATIRIPAGKRILWVLRAGPGCPENLTFASLLLYSAAVARGKFGRPVSTRQLAAAAGIDYFRAAPKAMSNLQQLGLVERQGKRWIALPPLKNWFSERKGKSDKWWDQIAFFKVAVPKPACTSTRLSSRANAVYWLSAGLLNRGRLWGMTQAGIARLLRVPAVTVLRSQKSLVTLGLMKGKRCPLPPEEPHLPLWADKVVKKTSEPVPKEKHDLSAVARMLRDSYSIPAGLAGTILRYFERAEWTPEGCRSFMEMVDGQSKAAMLSGKYKFSKHCGYLAKHKLEEAFAKHGAGNLAPASVREVVAASAPEPSLIPEERKAVFPWEQSRHELDNAINMIHDLVRGEKAAVTRWVYWADDDYRQYGPDWARCRRHLRHVLWALIEQEKAGGHFHTLDLMKISFERLTKEYLEGGCKRFPNPNAVVVSAATSKPEVPHEPQRKDRRAEPLVAGRPSDGIPAPSDSAHDDRAIAVAG